MWALNKEPYISGFILEIITGAISVADPIVSFSGILPEKEVFSDSESDESCK